MPVAVTNEKLHPEPKAPRAIPMARSSNGAVEFTEEIFAWITNLPDPLQLLLIKVTKSRMIWPGKFCE